MADKRLDQVTKVTDMAYVPVIMADGSIGQIAKADLASVVAEMIGTGYVSDLNSFNSPLATGMIQESTLNSPIASETDSTGIVSNLRAKYSNENVFMIQIVSSYMGRGVFIRTCWNNIWYEWKRLY